MIVPAGSAMRRGARPAALVLLLAGCAGLSATAQNSAQQNVTVIVLDALPQQPQPIKAVRVSLSYLDSSVLVTDAQQVTNTQGQALLLVSPGVAQRGNLRIGVTGASDLVIYQPADGQLPALPATVSVSMLPKGSPALLGPAQIEALLHRTLLQVNNLQKQVTALKQNAAAAQTRLGAWRMRLANSPRQTVFLPTMSISRCSNGPRKSKVESTQPLAEEKALAELA